MSGRRGRASGWAALLALAAVCLLAAPAGAGTYEVWSCRGPDGAPAATEGWALSSWEPTAGDTLLSDGCAGGGAIDVALASGRSFSGSPSARATFAAPRGTTIAGYTLWRHLAAAANSPPARYVYAAAVRERAGATTSERGCASTLAPPDFDCSTAGSASAPDAPGNRVDRSGVQLDALELWAACNSAGCDPPIVPPPARAVLFGARIVLDDTAAPAAPRLSGTLTEPAPVSGPATLVVESSDEGGGIAAMTLALDGGQPKTIPLAGSRETCRQPYTAPRPCPADAAHAFTVDTAGLAEGGHSAAGTVVDAGGNATSWGPIAFTVRHAAVPPPPPPPAPPGPGPSGGGPDNGVPAVATPRLRLDRRRVTHAAGRDVRLTGTLRTAEGAPIAGARLTVSAQLLGTVAPRVRTLAPVRTSARGTFALRVRGTGVRRLAVAFAPTAAAAPTAVARAVLRERARLSVARSRARLRRGQTVTLSGRLRGAGPAARGAIVELQAVVSGRWRTVGTVRAGRGGAYRWGYRFVRVTRDTVFSFRAVVRRTPGWPLPEQRSARVRVRVDAA